MGATGGDRPTPIPAEFQEVEWVQPSGNVVLSFDLKLPKDALTVTGKTEFTPDVTARYLFADRDTGGVRFCILANSEKTFRCYSGIFAETGELSLDPHLINFTAEISKPVQSGTGNTDGTIRLFGDADGISFDESNSGKIRSFGNNNIQLFGITGVSNTNYTGKMIGRLIVFTNQLVYAFVPCYRIADSAIGIYEAVTGEFRSSAKLIKGADA